MTTVEAHYSSLFNMHIPLTKGKMPRRTKGGNLAKK